MTASVPYPQWGNLIWKPDATLASASGGRRATAVVGSETTAVVHWSAPVAALVSASAGGRRTIVVLLWYIGQRQWR